MEAKLVQSVHRSTPKAPKASASGAGDLAELLDTYGGEEPLGSEKLNLARGVNLAAGRGLLEDVVALLVAEWFVLKWMLCV